MHLTRCPASRPARPPCGRPTPLGLVAVLLLLVAAGRVAFGQSGQALVTSPNGRLAFRLSTIADGNSAPGGGQLVYEVTYRDRPLLARSGLGLELEGQRLLGGRVRLLEAETSTMDHTYRLVTGKASTVRDHYHALRVRLAEPEAPHRQMTLEVRAYDDAVAFRYLVPAQPGLASFRLTKERTEFRLSKDPFIYALILPHYRSMYESEFIRLSASSLANQGGVASTVLLGLPLLMEVPGVAWLAITEADLRDNAAMYLVNPAGNWSGHWFESRLAPQIGATNLSVTGTLPHHSAWRVLLVGDEPGRLIEANTITSLSPDSVLSDTSWIHAGKAAWDWWSGSLGPDGRSSYNTATMRYYVDFAATAGFPYMLVDAGWWARGDITRMNGRVDIPGLVRYAAGKGVRIWIWLGYQEANRQMQAAFPLYEHWGVAGVKIDFIERDDQEGIEFYYRAAALAAQHHLLVDFHGATKPTGLDRTYPNVLGYEAVAGMEQSKAGSRDNPEHHVTLPFTRMLAGRMDYTPGGFANVTREEFEPRMERPMVMGTRAHQLAMYVVYEAPFQMVSDYPGAYAGQPAFAFIQRVPATWDETRVLGGAPGQWIGVARRSGRDWYLGAMTDWEPRELDLALSFLAEGRYLAHVYADAADADQFPKHVHVADQRVRPTTHLRPHLAPGGGYAVWLQCLSHEKPSAK